MSLAVRPLPPDQPIAIGRPAFEPPQAGKPSAPPQAGRPSAPPPVPVAPDARAGGLLARGMQGVAVRQVQQRLAALGYDPGPVDGHFGPRTEAAVRRLQQACGLRVDGVVGPRTLAALATLGSARTHVVPDAPATPRDQPARPGAPATQPAWPSAPDPGAPSAEHRLAASLDNGFRNRVRQCFRYAWAVVERAGLRPMASATPDASARGRAITDLPDLAARGVIAPGAVVYVNHRPGTDPCSLDLTNGPHWFVYMGPGRYADQYGVRDAEGMAAFVPGRVIDTVFHTA